jgi:hypothetical protein
MLTRSPHIMRALAWYRRSCPCLAVHRWEVIMGGRGKLHIEFGRLTLKLIWCPYQRVSWFIGGMTKVAIIANEREGALSARACECAQNKSGPQPISGNTAGCMRCRESDTAAGLSAWFKVKPFYYTQRALQKIASGFRSAQNEKSWLGPRARCSPCTYIRDRTFARVALRRALLKISLTPSVRIQSTVAHQNQIEFLLFKSLSIFVSKSPFRGIQLMSIQDYPARKYMTINNFCNLWWRLNLGALQITHFI